MACFMFCQPQQVSLPCQMGMIRGFRPSESWSYVRVTGYAVDTCHNARSIMPRQLTNGPMCHANVRRNTIELETLEAFQVELS